MKRVYLITVPERVWHWVHALLFVLLLTSGFLMHGGAGFLSVSFPALVAVHNIAAVLFVLDLLFFFAYQALSGRWRHYFRLERDFPRRLVAQGVFYARDIFRGAPHPFGPSEDSKFNPLQRITYLGLMFGLVPLQALTGLILLGFTLRVSWLMNLSWFRAVALLHTGLGYLLAAFLIGHLYLATTGESPASYLRTMLTGWHELGDAHDPGSVSGPGRGRAGLSAED